MLALQKTKEVSENSFWPSVQCRQDAGVYANTARQETGNSNTYGEGAYDNDSPRAWESSEGGVTYQIDANPRSSFLLPSAAEIIKTLLVSRLNAGRTAPVLSFISIPPAYTAPIIF